MKKPFFDKSAKSSGQSSTKDKTFGKGKPSAKSSTSSGNDKPFGKGKTSAKSKAPAKPKTPARPALRLPSGWYLMVQEEVTVTELQSVMTKNLLETEIWKDAGILEVILKEKCSLDLETCPLDLEDDYSNEFLAEHKIHSLFYASFPDEAYEEARTALRHILKVYGGIVCGDTEDFMPHIEA